MKVRHEEFWPIGIAGNVTVYVQPFIHQMSSYVLLEQEDWFEDEMSFVRQYIQPDMNVLDIGANHGVYALSIAKILQSGHVWAFEPTQSPYTKLEQSIKLNQFSERITLVNAGLSNRSTTAVISTSINSELNSLYGSGEGKETIQLEALDEYLSAAKLNQKFSFVKLDAEGEEINVLKGGGSFFAEQSPLIMFELKHGNDVNHGLIDAVKSYDYKIYRLLPDLNILVEYDDIFKDGYLLNLFACKDDRAQDLINRGLLATSLSIKKALESNFSLPLDWFERVKQYPYAQVCYAKWSSSISEVPQNYLAAISACLRAYDISLTSAQRVALLAYSKATLDEMTQNNQASNVAPWLLKIHVLHLSGLRSAALALAKQVEGAIEKTPLTEWPFIPPTIDDFVRVPKDDIDSWLKCCVAEFIEKRKSFSTYFDKNPLENIVKVLNNPNHSLAIDRRALLIAKRINKPVNVAENHPLLNDSLSKNASIWRSICAG